MLCLASLFLFAAAGAPSLRDSVVALPEVLVEGARLTDDPALRLSPGFARAYDVTRSHGRLVMASDLLAGGVGVHVRQFGGLGSYSAVSIRGSAASQVAFYLDGVPLNQAQFGVVNASDLPIEALERMDVYRGAASLGLDSPGGGAVELVSRKDPGTWARVHVAGGSFDTRQLDGAAGWAGGRTNALVVAQSLEGDGDFPYRDDNDTPDNPGDDTDTTRANNAFTARALTARLAQGTGAWTFSGTYDRLSKDHGVPGTGANQALQSTFATDRSVTSLSATAPSWLLSPDVKAYYADQRDRFADPARELTGSRQDNDDHTQRLGARAAARVALPAANSLALVTEGRRELYTPKMNLPAPRVLPQSERVFFVYGAEDRWSAPGGRLGLTGQVRQEATFDDLAAGPAYPGALPSPAVSRTIRFTRWTAAARWAFVDGTTGTLAARASVSRLGRVPTLEELFGNRGTVHGNRSAAPERMWTRDLGVEGQAAFSGGGFVPRTLDGQASIYRTEAEDLLVFMQASNSASVAQNVSAARLDGFEIAARAAWAAGVTADLSWTHQWTADTGDVAYWRGKELPGHPQDELSLDVAGTRGPARVFGELHAMSSFALDRYNQQRIPARTLVDLGAGLGFLGGAAEVTAECRNVGDVRTYDFIGYPLPGRVWSLGLRYRFERKDGSS